MITPGSGVNHLGGDRYFAELIKIYRQDADIRNSPDELRNQFAREAAQLREINGSTLQSRECSILQEKGVGSTIGSTPFASGRAAPDEDNSKVLKEPAAAKNLDAQLEIIDRSSRLNCELLLLKVSKLLPEVLQSLAEAKSDASTYRGICQETNRNCQETNRNTQGILQSLAEIKSNVRGMTISANQAEKQRSEQRSEQAEFKEILENLADIKRKLDKKPHELDLDEPTTFPPVGPAPPIYFPLPEVASTSDSRRPSFAFQEQQLIDTYNDGHKKLLADFIEEFRDCCSKPGGRVSLLMPEATLVGSRTGSRSLEPEEAPILPIDVPIRRGALSSRTSASKNRPSALVNDDVSEMGATNGAESSEKQANRNRRSKRSSCASPRTSIGESNFGDVTHMTGDIHRRSRLSRCSTISAHANSVIAHKIKGKDLLASPVQRFVGSEKYQTIMCCAIFLQAVLLGVEIHIETIYADDRVQGRGTQDVPVSVKGTTTALAVFFLIELMFRISVLRQAFFFPADKDKRGWNVFDFFVVTLSVIELIPTYQLMDVSVVRTLRLVRIIRVLRAARFLPELRKMILALLSCMSSLFWLCTLMCLLLYMFALVFMQGAAVELNNMAVPSTNTNSTVSPHSASVTGPFPERRLLSSGNAHAIFGCSIRPGTSIHKYCNWVGLGNAMISLFSVVTAGDEWDEVLEPIMDAHVLYYFIGLFFVVFFVFGFMNVATGLFVDRAMQIAKANRQLMVEEAAKVRAADEKLMRELFSFADMDGDGSLSVDELQVVVQNKSVKNFLLSIDLDITSDLQAVLRALDPDNSGQVDAEDFFNILGRLRGHARSMETTLCLLELRNTAKKVHHIHHAHKKLHKHIFDNAEVRASPLKPVEVSPRSEEPAENTEERTPKRASLRNDDYVWGIDIEMKEQEPSSSDPFAAERRQQLAI